MEEVIAHVKQTSFNSVDSFPPRNLFLAKYHALPQKVCIKPVSKAEGFNAVFHVQSVVDRIENEYGIRNQLPIVKRYYHRCSKKYFVFEQLISLANIDGIMLHFDDCLWVTNYLNHSNKLIQPDYRPDRHFLMVKEIVLYYLSEHEVFVQKFVHDLIHDDTLSILEPKITELRFIGKHKDRCDGPGAFYLTGFVQIKKPRINNLSVSYGGDDFLRVHHQIVTWLNRKNSSGLVLLHGAPGSGKTHYIRYLLHSVRKETEKTPIYIPGDMINELTSPRLLPLLTCHPNSLLIIEDAEGSLSRTRGSSQSIANLLNLSDGLLSDGIQAQILATFNCPLLSLDPALLRSGRLIVEYCFPSTLTIDNARRLAELIGVTKIDQIKQAISLADVYSMRDEKIEEEQDESKASHCLKCSSSNLYRHDGGEEE